MPEEMVGGGGLEQSAGVVGSVETPDSGASLAISGGVADVSGGQAAAPAGGGGGMGYVPVHEAVRGYGYELPEGVQDHAALAHLVSEARRARELQQLAGYGQEYLQHQSQFQEWIRAQQEAARAKETQKADWWKKPEYDPGWMAKLVRDPATGELKAAPGADPTIVQKYMQWVGHQQKFLDEFSQDPIQALRPGLESVAREIAERIVQEKLGGYQSEEFARGFVEQNAGWLFEKDHTGRSTRNLSAGGKAFAGYVRQAESLGIQDVKKQQEYALGLVQRDAALARLQSGAGVGGTQLAQRPTTPQAGFAEAYNPSRAATNAGVQNAPAIPPQSPQTPKDLMDMMMRSMQANGFMPGQELPMDTLQVVA